MQKANHSRNAERIMTSSRRYISKTLLLLAAVLVPLQQSFAANCCCRQGSSSEMRHADDTGMSCCSQNESSCCSTEDTATTSCCGDKQDTEANHCHCPAGSCGQDDPTTAEPPATSEIPDGNELVQAALTSPAASDSKLSLTAKLPNATATRSLGGADRCVLLCRFTL